MIVPFITSLSAFVVSTLDCSYSNMSIVEIRLIFNSLTLYNVEHLLIYIFVDHIS